MNIDKYIKKNFKRLHNPSSKFSYFANKSGVYLLVFIDIEKLLYKEIMTPKILYVGSTKHFYTRFRSHEIVRFLHKFYSCIQIYIRPEVEYKKEEIKLIKKLKPEYNTQHCKYK